MSDLRLLWVSLADQRPGRELAWFSRIPGAQVSTVADADRDFAVPVVRSRIKRPISRFQEAGAVAWYESTEVWPTDIDWVGSLEPAALISGQVSRWRARHGIRQFVVTWENDQYQPLYRVPGFRKALRTSLAADLFLCPIRGARDHLRALGVPSSRIEVVAPGVDTRLFHPPTEPVQAPRIVFASPLARNKGVDRLIAALPWVQHEVPDVELAFMGRGPMLRDVMQAQARGLPVTHAGSGGPVDVAAFLRSGALFVTAPRPTWKWNEQFGLAYLEAMATGLPVVTTRCGTNHEAVRPPNGFVEDDIDELASAMVRFLRDPALRADVGAANRALVVRDHDAAAQARQLGDVLRARM